VQLMLFIIRREIIFSKLINNNIPCLMASQTKSYIAFFDLDHTIVNQNSSASLIKLAYKKGVMRTGNLINAIIQGYLYKFNLRDTNLIISKMGTWAKGLESQVIEKLSEEVVNKNLKANIRPEIIKEIDFHKNNNAGTIILSSAISSICEAIARYVGIDYSICSTLETADGILTGAPLGNFCFGDEKRIRLLSYCEKNNYEPSEAWYYADSISDLPAFEVVGHPVCVYPDSKLEKIARKRGWRVIDKNNG
jgi:HAD superfamily hydrolase (TIGR01490 family)